jgi:hypothetical protein
MENHKHDSKQTGNYMWYSSKQFSFFLSKKFLRCCVSLFILLIVFVPKVIGQATYKMPTVIDPSPQSMAFTRYGDYPMAAYTGLTDITIPIHNIIGRKLSLPITMSFHASGRMANETNGILGMRWTLNCGGLVTRTMKGQPDEWNGLTPFDITPYINTSNVPSFDVLHNACPDGKILGQSIYDSEYGIFNYVLPNGKQGHFILKNVNGTKVPMTIPYEPIKIETFNELLYWGMFIQRIKITDVDGTQYFFGQIDAYTANAIEVSEEWHHPTMGTDNSPVRTAWYLTKITSSDGTDEISLLYNTRNENLETTSQYSKIYDKRRNSSVLWIPSDCDYDPYECDLMNRLGLAYYFDQSPSNQIDVTPILKIVPVLNGIQFNGGSVSFNYINTFLNEMIINRGTTPYKKIKFNFTNNPQEDPLYHLDNLAFYGEDQNTINEKYSFSYYQGGNVFTNPGAKRDWWGYYTWQATNLIPLREAESVTYLENGGGYQDIGFQSVQRDGDANSKMMGMLKTITYPTGGQTEFIYEGNMYNYGDAPGIRIGEVISKPVGGNDIHKIYKYGINEDGYGFINEYLRPGSFSRKDLVVIEGNEMHFWDYYSGGYWDEQMGFRTREYLTDPYIRFDLEGSQIKYDAVSEYYLEEGYPRQKTRTIYSWGDNEQVSDFIVHDYDPPIFYPRKFSNPENAYLKPVMVSKTSYKYSNNQFDPVRKETYEYSPQEKDEAWDMPTYLHTNVVYARHASSATDHYNLAKLYHDNDCSVYGYGFRQYKSGTQRLYNLKVEEYTPNGTMITEKHPDYDDVYDFVKSEETTNSKNETIKTTYSYPHNFPTELVYQQMVQKNILAPVIEQSSYKNNNFLQSTKTNYNFWNGSAWSGTATDFIVPQTVDTKTFGQSTYETRLRYSSYDDKANLTTVLKETDVKKTYLWGYNKTYPVAEIIGVDYATASTYVNQSILDNPADDASLRSHLNNLRNIPGALVTTYTYRPLVGMTSQTDANNRTSYYFYDAFGRLAFIRDKDNNVIKKFCYNYAGQLENCTTPIFSNAVKSGTYTRTNCTSGTGSSVTYTVPAGTYTSYVSQPDADQQAQNDVNNNGQAYANANGVCTVTCSFSMSSGFYSTTATVSSTVSPPPSTTTFNLVFSSSSTMILGTQYMVATISNSCRPLNNANKTMTLFSVGRTFVVTIYGSTGLMGVRPISGGNVPSSTYITLSGGYVQ